MLSAEIHKGTRRDRGTGILSILSTLVSALIVSLLAGCGYQFRVEGGGPTIGGPTHNTSQETAPRLVIRTLLNRSFEPNLETRYTNYLRYEFASGGGAKVVSDFDAHDFILTGEILSVTTPTLSFSQTATLESRAEVVVRVSVEDVKTKKVVWSQLARGASEFYVTKDLQFNRALQNRALEQAGRFAAADLAAWFLLHVESGGLSTQADTPAPVSP